MHTYSALGASRQGCDCSALQALDVEAGTNIEDLPLRDRSRAGLTLHWHVQGLGANVPATQPNVASITEVGSSPTLLAAGLAIAPLHPDMLPLRSNPMISTSTHPHATLGPLISVSYRPRTHTGRWWCLHSCAHRRIR